MKNQFLIGAALIHRLREVAPLFEDGSLAWEQQTIRFDRVARLASQAIASQFDPLLVSGAGHAALP